MQKKKTGEIFRVPVILMIVMLVCLCGTYSSAEEGQNDKVLAKVGDVVITQQDLDEQIAALPPKYRGVYSTENGKTQLLQRMVQIQMLAMAARDEKIHKNEKTKAVIEGTIDQILAQEYVKKKLLSFTPEISAKEIEDYYNGHKGEFKQPATAKARHILISVGSKATPEEITKARDQARMIKKQLDGGADFAELATKYSQDPGSKDRGGELGFFTKERLVPEFAEVAFALKKGETSDLVRTEFGYHIIRVEETKAEAEKSLQEVEPQIKAKLVEEKRGEAIQEDIKILEKKYGVKFY